MIEYLNNNALFGTIFIFVVVTLAILGVRFKLFHNFSVPYIIGWLIELICPILILLFQFIEALASIGQGFNLLGMTLYAFVFLISALDGVALAALLFKDSDLINQLTYVEQNQLEGYVLAYISPDYKLIDTTEKFKHHFSVGSDWRTQIKSFMIDNQEVPVKDILKTIKTLKDKAFKVTVVLKDQDDALVKECAIKPMYQIHHLMAYAIVAAEDTYTDSYLKSQARQAKKELYNYFDIVTEPVAYYDSTLKLLNLNKLMASILNTQEEELSIEAFREYVNDNDKAAYDALLNVTEAESEVVAMSYLHLKTINGENIFKVSYLQNDGKQYIMMVLARFKELELTLGTEQDLLASLSLKEHQNQTLRMVGIHFKNIQAISEKLGADVAEAFIHEYFITLVRDKVIQASAIYALNSLDYVVTFDTYQNYEMVLRDLNQGISKMLNMNCFVGAQSTLLQAYVVSLDSSRVVVKALQVIDMIKNYLAMSSQDSRYVVIEQKDNIKEQAQIHGIDLSEGALDSILNK